MSYQVIVANIGTVYDGADSKKANATFKEYKSQSTGNYGRAGGETVVMMKDGELHKEHVGKLDKTRAI